jgi:hypothetical protein
MASSEAERTFATIRTVDGQPVKTMATHGRPVSTQNQGPAWFRVAPAPQPGLQPPLGWTLSESTVADMRAQLRSASNTTTIARLKRLLSSPMSCPTSTEAPQDAAPPSR